MGSEDFGANKPKQTAKLGGIDEEKSRESTGITHVYEILKPFI